MSISLNLFTSRKLRTLLIGAAAALGLSLQPPSVAAPTSADGWQSSRQLVLVLVDNWDANHGELRTFERTPGSSWHQASEAQPVTIGKAGAAWGLGLNPTQHAGPTKREGDNRSPAGVFRIGEAFGYAATAKTALPYRALSVTDYCVDVSTSPDYNQIVDAKAAGAAAVKGSSEPMRRDLHLNGDQHYRLGFVIEDNAQAVPKAGSCIFAHLWDGPTDTTVGCTAMAPPVMDSLLAWLQPAKKPIFVLLPRSEYQRLQTTWQLPALRTGARTASTELTSAATKHAAASSGLRLR